VKLEDGSTLGRFERTVEIDPVEGSTRSLYP